VADESTLVIEELSGLKRSVALRGPSLPFQGVNWGGTQRVTTTWYPGNAAEATQHVLGPVEKPTTLNGVWRSTQLTHMPTEATLSGSPAAIADAFSLRELLEDIFRLGQRLRVKWQNNERKIVREGRCVDWDFSYERADDIEWTATFDWSSRGARQLKVSTRKKGAQSVLAQLTLQLDAIATKLAAIGVQLDRQVPSTFSTFSLGQIENFLDGPLNLFKGFARAAQRLSNRIKKVGELINKVRTMPYQFAKQALDIANNAITIANQFADQISRTPPEANLVKVKAAQLATAAAYYGDGVRQADFVKDAANQLKKLVEDSAKQQSTILSVYIVRGTKVFPKIVDGTIVLTPGETLVSISFRFYGTYDHSPSIAKANGLPLNQQIVERGTILVIPTLDAIKGFDPNSG
tara:strand:- start:292 stop:1509 length:1218 start_codon:yes stop_codon:yes gene_type:complete